MAGRHVNHRTEYAAAASLPHLEYCNVLVLVKAHHLGRVLCATHEGHLNITGISDDVIVGDHMACMRAEKVSKREGAQHTKVAVYD